MSKVQQFGASFGMPDVYKDDLHALDYYKKKVGCDLGLGIIQKFDFTKIPDIIPQADCYMIKLVVMTPEEYTRLKDYEYKYKGLEK